MFTTMRKWALRLLVAAALATVVARIALARSVRDRSGGSPVIGGDTWPPVPTNRAQLRAELSGSS